ncbi:MAG: hypothetical protein ACR2PR_03445, partial [Pseudohongiellaceae bacterium]
MAEPNFEQGMEGAIANPAAETIPADDVLPDGVEPEKSGIPLFEFLDAGNLVDEVAKLPGGLQEVSANTTTAYNVAYESMAKWRAKYEKALKLAKLEPEAEKKTFPFEDASQVMLPFIL